MQETYDREKAAALIKQAQEITALLRAETECLARQMVRVLEGGEEQPDDDLKGGRHQASKAQPVGKSMWRFWR